MSTHTAYTTTNDEVAELMAGHRNEAQRVVSLALAQGMDRLEALRLARGPIMAASRAQLIARAEREWTRVVPPRPQL
ncbi:MAG: hypothetical protein ACR2K6_02930 [Solirubrobacterales bacterium]